MTNSVTMATAAVVIMVAMPLLQRRKAVVITARIHPGESNSSWMMKGFLDYLVGNSADAKVGCDRSDVLVIRPLCEKELILTLFINALLYIPHGPWVLAFAFHFWHTTHNS